MNAAVGDGAGDLSEEAEAVVAGWAREQREVEELAARLRGQRPDLTVRCPDGGLLARVYRRGDRVLADPVGRVRLNGGDPSRSLWLDPHPHWLSDESPSGVFFVGIVLAHCRCRRHRHSVFEIRWDVVGRALHSGHRTLIADKPLVFRSPIGRMFR